MASDQTDSPSPVLSRARVAVVGRGRPGTALCAALGAAGVQVRGPLARDELVARTGALSDREALL